MVRDMAVMSSVFSRVRVRVRVRVTVRVILGDALPANFSGS